jgi:hypothetical protein
MNTCKRHRFLPDIISDAVWLYYRFNLSHRDIAICLPKVASLSAGNQSASGASSLERSTPGV